MRKTALILALVLFPNSASSASWATKCTRDSMTDQTICQITNSRASVMLFYGAEPTPQSICVYANNFPGRSGMIRIDGNPAVETSDKGCFPPTAQFLEQMRRGSKVSTRFYLWPRDYPQDASASLKGLSQAMDKVNSLRNSAR